MQKKSKAQVLTMTKMRSLNSKLKIQYICTVLKSRKETSHT